MYRSIRTHSTSSLCLSSNKERREVSQTCVLLKDLLMRRVRAKLNIDKLD